ncbi:MAG: YchF family ATPase [Bacteroidales bacterium]|nr:YchF family ATPase [Candidatus Latescibacterota bacterium]
MIVAFTGLQQSGKTTLFSAVSGKEPSPGKQGSVDEAVVSVPDPRFKWLVDYYDPQKVTNATIECLDLPGIDPLTSEGLAMSRRILGAARKADMLALVIRAFDRDDGGDQDKKKGPLRDLEILRGELLLADLELVTTRIERLMKEVKKPSKFQQERKAELEVQVKLQEVLEDDRSASDADLSENELDIVRSLGLLTMKPVIAVFNTDDNRLGIDASEICGGDCPVTSIAICAEIEKELPGLDDESRKEFMNELGLEKSAADLFVRTCYTAMGLISFLTVGEDEVRAWPVKKGTPALEAAGKIHSDIKRGFIRAETMSYGELREFGDEKALRAAGKARLEGKEYVVRDGDIISFRFNV